MSKSDRQQFETWARANVGFSDFSGKDGDNGWSYEVNYIDLAWRAWCAAEKPAIRSTLVKYSNDDRTMHIIGTLQKFATNGLPASVEPEHPVFKSVDEANDWWKRWLNIADDTLRRVSDVALSSVPEAERNVAQFSGDTRR